jgi:hypothetical protein
MEEKYLKYVNEFNNGEIEELLPFFDNVENILKFFNKKGVINLIDPFSSDLSDYQNEILYFLLNVVNDKDTLLKCINQFNDVVFENNEYYLKLSDRESLADLFDPREGRDGSTRNAVKYVLGEESMERYWDTTDDVYRDVIDVLDNENIERLKKYMLDILTNWKVEVDDSSPDLFNNYSEDDIFYLTPENVGDVISDEESMNYLMDEGYLDELRSELYSIHDNAYNSAYESEVYDDVMSELSTFFDTSSAKWEAIPSRYNPEKLIEHYVLKFNPNELKNSILKYVSDRSLWGYTDNCFENWGKWVDMMENLMQEGEEPWLDFRIPDYADWSLTQKYINEMFGDYI